MLTYVTIIGTVKQKTVLVFNLATHIHKTDPVNLPGGDKVSRIEISHF